MPSLHYPPTCFGIVSRRFEAVAEVVSCEARGWRGMSKKCDSRTRDSQLASTVSFPIFPVFLLEHFSNALVGVAPFEPGNFLLVRAQYTVHRAHCVTHISADRTPTNMVSSLRGSLRESASSPVSSGKYDADSQNDPSNISSSPEERFA